MATQSTVIAALQDDPVPTDRECVKTLTEILAGVKDFMKVTGLAAATPGNPFPTSNSLSAQALETANTALSKANEALGKIPERRTSGGPVSVPAGDSIATLTWTPAMGTSNYIVLVNILDIDATPNPSAYGWCVVSGSAGVSGVQVGLENIPAGATITWSVEAL